MDLKMEKPRATNEANWGYLLRNAVTTIPQIGPT